MLTDAYSLDNDERLLREAELQPAAGPLQGVGPAYDDVFAWLGGLAMEYDSLQEAASAEDNPIVRRELQRAQQIVACLVRLIIAHGAAGRAAETMRVIELARNLFQLRGRLRLRDEPTRFLLDLAERQQREQRADAARSKSAFKDVDTRNRVLAIFAECLKRAKKKNPAGVLAALRVREELGIKRGPKTYVRLYNEYCKRLSSMAGNGAGQCSLPSR